MVLLPRKLGPGPGPGPGQSGGRIHWSKEAKEAMKEAFKNNPYLSKSQAEELAEKWKIPQKKIKNWFKNLRQKLKREGVNLYAKQPGPGRRAASV